MDLPFSFLCKNTNNLAATNVNARNCLLSRPSGWLRNDLRSERNCKQDGRAHECMRAPASAMTIWWILTYSAIAAL